MLIADCLIQFFSFPLSARSHLIESPPTYNSYHGFKSWEVYSNLSYYARAVPPVDHDCPTPMGVKGKKESKSVHEDWRKNTSSHK